MLQQKNSTTTISNKQDIKLSIQFSLDGFCFCITNTQSNTILHFFEYLFTETLQTPENLLVKVEEIFKKDPHLQNDFSNITVIHQNNLFALVPTSYFTKNNLADYLNFNIKTLATDFITFDEINTINAKNIYIPYVNINNYLFQNFGEFEYKHHITELVKKLIEATDHNEKTMFVNVCKTTFDIVILQNKNLLLANSFSFSSKDDFVYYILFVAEQLELKTEEFELYFMGQINTTSEIYKTAFEYIRNIYFLESKNTIFKDLNIAKHSNYILLGS